MKSIFILLILTILNSCSFDKKTGIWKDENAVPKNKKIFKDFNRLSTLNEPQKKDIPIKDGFNFKITAAQNNFKWTDELYQENNNLENFTYTDNNKIILKSKKLSRSTLNKKFLYNENLIFLSDTKGNIILYSIDEDRLIKKINFYKKKYKNINKKINLIFENHTLYVSDNIGYIYAYNIKKNKYLWAKKNKVPFRSNLKLSKNKLITSDQNNNFYFFDKKTGKLLKMIPTEETVVNNLFINNLSKSENSIFFLNTYGSLYSFDILEMRLNWFVNLNQSLSLNTGNLFYGGNIIIQEEKAVVSSRDFTYIINSNNGLVEFKKKFSSKVNPIISNNYLFTVTNQNLLLALNLKNGEIIYGYNIDKLIANFLDKKIKRVEIKKIMLLNNKIFVLSDKNFLYTFSLYGNLEKLNKLPSKLISDMILIDNSILFLNDKKKLVIID